MPGAPVNYRKRNPKNINLSTRRISRRRSCFFWSGSGAPMGLTARALRRLFMDISLFNLNLAQDLDLALFTLGDASHVVGLSLRAGP